MRFKVLTLNYHHSRFPFSYLHPLPPPHHLHPTTRKACHSKWTTTPHTKRSTKEGTGLVDGQCERLLKEYISARLAAKERGGADAAAPQPVFRVPVGTTCTAICQQSNRKESWTYRSTPTALFTCTSAGMWGGRLMCPGTEAGKVVGLESVSERFDGQYQLYFFLTFHHLI
jgi:hypothetical protein